MMEKMYLICYLFPDVSGTRECFETSCYHSEHVHGPCCYEFPKNPYIDVQFNRLTCSNRISLCSKAR